MFLLLYKIYVNWYILNLVCQLSQLELTMVHSLLILSVINCVSHLVQSIKKTCIHTPQQNSIVERKHKHILEVVRIVKFQGHIPLRFWGHCFLSAAYIINRLPTPVLNRKSPYEVLYKSKPSLHHLRVIGCLCFAKNIYISDKFQSRSVVAVHMGYSEQTKGYVLYDMKDKYFFQQRWCV